VSALLSAVTGWTLFGGLALSIGAVTSRWLILPRAFAGEDSASRGLPEEVARVGIAGSLLVVVGIGLYFLRQLLEFRDPFVPWTDDAEILLSIGWGKAWMRAAAGSLVALAAFLIAGKAPSVGARSLGWWLATPVVLALGSFPGLTGHAAAADRFREASLLADATHVWAAGAWMGGLAVVLYLERGARRRGEGSAGLLPALVPAFSTVAMFSVGALVVTGSFATWSHMPSLSALFGSTYGRALVIKLALVAVVLGLGAKNFKVLSPRLGTAEGDDAMRRSATIELLVAQLVLVVTAALVRTSPISP